MTTTTMPPEVEAFLKRKGVPPPTKLVQTKVQADDSLIQCRLINLVVDSKVLGDLDILFDDSGKELERLYQKALINREDPTDGVMLGIRLAAIALSPLNQVVEEQEVVWVVPGSKPVTRGEGYMKMFTFVYHIVLQPDFITALERCYNRRNCPHPFTVRFDNEVERYWNTVRQALLVIRDAISYIASGVDGETYAAMMHYESLISTAFNHHIVWKH